MNVLRRTLAMLLLLCAPSHLCAQSDEEQTGYAADFVMAAGDQDRAWILTRALDDRERPIVLFHAPDRLLTGSMRLVSQLAGPPEALCAAPDELICVFPPTEATEPLRRVRSYRVVDISGRELIEPASPLPPLPGRGLLLDMAYSAGAVTVLMHDDVHTLRVLEGAAWRLIELPAALSTLTPDALTLAQDATRATLVERTPDGPRLWTQADDAWTEDAALSAPPASRVMSVMGRRLIVHEQDTEPGGRSLVVRRASSDNADEVFRIELPDGGSAFAVAPLANTLVVVRPEGDGTTDVLMRVVDLTGAVLYDEPAMLRGPVSASDIQTLALAMAALGVLVVVFIVRPRIVDREPTLPEGWVLATPLRRMFGVVIDLLPGVIAVFVTWPEYLQAPQDTFSSTGVAGPWALGLVVIQLVVLGTIGEALFGRTIGKALTGMRTVDYDGHAPSWWMAFSRNVVRALCPPLAVFSAINPMMPHPASFQTLVLVRRREK